MYNKGSLKVKALV